MAKAGGGGRHWLAPILQNWSTTILQAVQLWTTQQLQLMARLTQEQIELAQAQDHDELVAGLAETEVTVHEWIVLAQQATEAIDAQARVALEARLTQAIQSAIAAAESRILAEAKSQASQNKPGIPGRGF